MKSPTTSTIVILILAGSSLPAATHYVSLGSTNPTPPYTDWVTAATNIQDAVNVAATNDLVLVTNGEYPGGVSVSKPLTMLSVNGPQFTIINGGGIKRCVYLTDGANLTGFTLRDGVGYPGGGVECASTNAFLTNCLIVGNRSGPPNGLGGGAYGGTLYNCTLSGNSAEHGAFGGGAYGSTLYNCTLSGNSAFASSGGSGGYGGGAASCTLYNCTLSGNSAVAASLSGSGGGYGGGAASCTLYNCLVYYNAGAVGTNYYSSILKYCCATPLPGGVGNISNGPLFVNSANGNLRLHTNSPCINAGNNAYVTTATDLDGNPRIVSGTVDIGAFEFQPGVNGAFIGWLQKYGLPTDGSADYADPDHDGLNNWQEWICGTNPTNALSALRMVSALPTSTNVTETWQSVAGVSYFLQRSTNLTAPFTLLATNILGQVGTTSYGDTNAAGSGPFFYRVGVQVP
jgi:hypothetical protein